MENTQQMIANQFWQDHFAEWLDTPLTEAEALQSNFWDALENKLESVDEHTAWAIALTNPIIKITSPDMHFRIVQIAKRESDRKHYQTDGFETRRRKELGLD